MDIHVFVHHASGDEADLKKTLAKILKLLELTMTKISDAVAAQRAAFTRLDTALSGLTGDVQSLNDKIVELQGTAGQVTPEDQVLLDEMQTMSEALVTKFEALDALTTAATPIPPADPVV